MTQGYFWNLQKHHDRYYVLPAPGTTRPVVGAAHFRRSPRKHFLEVDDGSQLLLQQPSQVEEGLGHARVILPLLNLHDPHNQPQCIFPLSLECDEIS